MKKQVIDLFSGVGGLYKGFFDSGWVYNIFVDKIKARKIF